MIRLGNASPPWETKYAGPSRGTGTIGVIALAYPTTDVAGQLAGFASNVLATHAFCNVFSREGSCLGELDFEAGDVRLGTLGSVGVAQFEGEARALFAGGAPGGGDLQGRFERECGAVGDLEAFVDRDRHLIGGVGRVRARAGDRRRDRLRFAAGGVDREVGAVDVNVDVADGRRSRG